MNIPKNGRIAIIDDQFEQAFPLINILSKNQCSFSYFTGEEKYLPEEGQNFNDIRLLFLDINLIDNAAHESKVIKGRLIPVLKRVISENNYPYVLVYWSRHENEYESLIQEIFTNDLPTRKPIAFLSQNKLDYFDLDGKQTEKCEELTVNLFQNICDSIDKTPAYGYLVNWENQAHFSVDNTLEEIFKSLHTLESWECNANYLLNQLGENYAGNGTYKNQSPEEKIISAYQAFNNVYIDTLEYLTNSSKIDNAKDLAFDENLIDKESVFIVNKKLLISEENNCLEYSGAVIEDSISANNSTYEDLLNNCLNRRKIEDLVKNDSANDGKSNAEISKIIKKLCSQKRREIRVDYRKICVVVTPLCDFIQNKSIYSRVVQGILIKANHLDCIDDKSEAVFITPKFKIGSDVFVLVLNFRYFFTTNTLSQSTDFKQIFRIRQQLLSEIQSKLARHINRQGVLFLDIH
jgi:hypothetical protein